MVGKVQKVWPSPAERSTDGGMSRTLTHEALAELVGGKLVSGDPSLVVTGLNSLADAQAGEVSFLGNPRYAAQLGTTAATAVLVGADHAQPLPGKALILVENPTLAFSAVIRFFGSRPQEHPPGIHPTAHVAASAKLDPAKVSVGPNAVVQENAVIGDGSVIQAGAFIGYSVRLGKDCIIHPNASVLDHCVLGDRVVLHSASVVGSDGFGYEFAGGKHVKVEQLGNVQIDDDVEIGSCTSIDRARFGKTHIGAGTKIDNQVQIAHNVVTGKHCVLVSQVGISGSTHLGDYVVMGGQSGAAGHLRIASQTTLLGRSGAIKDITEPGQHWTGFPARPLGEGRRLMAYPAMVPGLQQRVKSLEAKLAELEAKLIKEAAPAVAS
jgi:UDP-3-O-[3-hydroxymyristoyl] glucosamine N-acyltransferase